MTSYGGQDDPAMPARWPVKVAEPTMRQDGQLLGKMVSCESKMASYGGKAASYSDKMPAVGIRG
jgi:hypothetical protein